MRRLLAVVSLICSAANAENFVMPPEDASRYVVTRDATQHVDIYRPKGNANVPVVIFVNSTGGDYPGFTQYTGWAQYLAANGVGAVVYARPASDFDAVIDFVRNRAADLHLDANSIVFWACSTNVSLGLPAAMETTRDYLRGAIIYYGFADVKTIRVDLPVLYVRAGLDSGGMNRRVDETITKAIAANAPWIIENNAAGYHGFDILNANDVSRSVIERTLQFVKDVTSPRVARAYREVAADAAVGAPFQRGDFEEVVHAYEKRTNLDAEQHRRYGIALLETKRFADALRELEAAWEGGRRGTRDTAVPAARAAAGAGNVERTVYWLNEAMKTRFGPTVEELRTSTDYEKVRDDPRFQLLLGKP